MKHDTFKGVSMLKMFVVITLILLCWLFATPAFTQTPFYQGKTITIVQGTEPGGSSDTMTRALLPHLKKHIPGEPTIVSEYMPGGGGISCQSYFQECAPGRTHYGSHRRRLGCERRPRRERCSLRP